MKLRRLRLIIAIVLGCMTVSPASMLAQQHGDPEDANGFYNRTGMDLLYSDNSSTARYFTINGYRFSENMSAGIGVGFAPYNDPLGLFPVFSDITYHLSGGDVSPFVYLRMGYSFSRKSDEEVFMENHEGGLMMNSGIGVQFQTAGSWGWYFNAGINRDRSSHSFDSWGNRTVQNNNSYRRINLGIGVVF